MTSENEVLRKLEINPLKNSHCSKRERNLVKMKNF